MADPEGISTQGQPLMGIVVHYYTKNISDFNNATRHLTRLERSIYSDLLELQYDIETPLPNDIDWICRRVLAMNEEERTTVERMLNEWFDLVEEGWTNGRVEQEIEIYRSKIEKAKAAGKASGIARRRNKKPNKNNNNEHSLNGRSTNVEPTNNHEQQTTNDQPTNNNQQKNTDGKPPSRFPEFWEIYNYKKGRKKAEDVWKRKKLDNIADEVIDGARRYVQARGSETRYWKHAQGWLNDERWGDDYIPERENVKPRRRSIDEMNYGDVVEDL